MSRKEKDLEKILPQLHSINNSLKNKPVVKYYEGKNGIKTMVSEVFDVPNQTVLMAYSADAIEDFFSPKEREEWVKVRDQKKIKNEVIYTSKRAVLGPIKNSKRFKVSSDKYPITCDIAVYGNKIRLASLGSRLIGVVIEDEELAKSFASIMKLALEAAEKKQK